MIVVVSNINKYLDCSVVFNVLLVKYGECQVCVYVCKYVCVCVLCVSINQHESIIILCSGVMVICILTRPTDTDTDRHLGGEVKE